MPYVEDQHGNHIIDVNGNKIQYSVTYKKSDIIYKHKEPLHVDDNGFLNTENRNIVIKDAINQDHAVSKNQLDGLDTKITTAITILKSQITADLQAHEAKIMTQMLNFRNEQVKNRIQRKYLTIPKTINTWLKLFDNTDVGDGIVDLKDVIVLNVWIKRWDRYHNGKSALLEKDFNNSIELFYNSDMTGYYTYFSTVPSNWDMSCIIEWLRIPQPISIVGGENVVSKSESNE